MAELARSAAGLRIFGEDLDPEEITRLLGKAPTRSRRRGRPWFAPNGQPLGISPIGAWHVSAPRVEPGDLDAQIAAILDGLPEDPALWRDLCARYKIDLFCGLFMDGGNEGLRLSPQTLAGLSSRGISGAPAPATNSSRQVCRAALSPIALRAMSFPPLNHGEAG